MADISYAIFKAMFDLYEADTGTGGLNETGGNSRVTHFVRSGDPNVTPDRSHYWPMIVVDVFVNEARVFPNRRVEAIIRLHLYDNRDQNVNNLERQNAVSAAITTLFDGATLDTEAGVSFSLLNQLRNFQGPTTGVELHHVFEFSLICEVL